MGVPLFVLMFTLVFAGPLLASESTTSAGKDMCLLDSRNCSGQGYALLEKISRLKDEIAKGQKVYMPQELELLEKKLKEAEEILDLLNG